MGSSEGVLQVALPKGRLQKRVVWLLQEAGISIEDPGRAYRFTFPEQGLEVKLLKPQNIPQLVALGAYDLGFTGYDWVRETQAAVHELLDTGFDPVEIVAAIPEHYTPEEVFRKTPVRVASEYRHLTHAYLQEKGICEFVFIQSFGATEAFPPEDADLIVDNMATGTTLRANRLKVIDVLLRSSTRLIAYPASLQNSEKRKRIDALVQVLKSVLLAQERVLLEMNVPSDRLEEVVQFLPCMRAPTVMPLYGGAGYAVKVAVRKEEVPALIPKLKALGVTDILEYRLQKVIP